MPSSTTAGQLLDACRDNPLDCDAARAATDYLHEHHGFTFAEADAIVTVTREANMWRVHVSQAMALLEWGKPGQGGLQDEIEKEARLGICFNGFLITVMKNRQRTHVRKRTSQKPEVRISALRVLELAKVEPTPLPEA